MDIEPKAHIASVKARPFNTTFNRQVRSAQELYGKQLSMPKLSRREMEADLAQYLRTMPSGTAGIFLTGCTSAFSQGRNCYSSAG